MSRDMSSISFKKKVTKEKNQKVLGQVINFTTEV